MTERINEDKKRIKISEALKQNLSPKTKEILMSNLIQRGDVEIDDAFYTKEDILRINKERKERGEEPRFTFPCKISKKNKVRNFLR